MGDGGCPHPKLRPLPKDSNMITQYGVFELSQHGLVQVIGTTFHNTEAEALHEIVQLIEKDAKSCHQCSWMAAPLGQGPFYTIQTLYSKESHDH